jgi:hypothetical protein
MNKVPRLKSNLPDPPDAGPGIVDPVDPAEPTNPVDPVPVDPSDPTKPIGPKETTDVSSAGS